MYVEFMVKFKKRKSTYCFIFIVKTEEKQWSGFNN